MTSRTRPLLAPSVLSNLIRLLLGEPPILTWRFVLSILLRYCGDYCCCLDGGAGDTLMTTTHRWALGSRGAADSSNRPASDVGLKIAVAPWLNGIFRFPCVVIGGESESINSMMSENSTQEEGNITQRRKEKIMQSREDRLAKILSMASGRTVDPKEVHLERTPSPTISEVAAAGVGPVPKLDPTNASSSVLNSSTSSINNRIKSKSMRRVINSEAIHTMLILLTAIFFVVWHQRFYIERATLMGEQAAGSFMPWHILLAAFIAVESIEYMRGRLLPTSALGDAALYIFVIVILLKVLSP